MKGFPDLPPIWWVGSIAIIYVFKWLAPAWHIESGFLTFVSRAVFLSALVLVAWSAIWFWFKKTPIEPNHIPKTLIVEGPYRLSRNPIYLALVLLTVASAIGNGSIIGGVCAVFLWRVLDQRFAAAEETLLVETFGDEARAYLDKTGRWL
ncbi:MAG: methyltransferase [Paracoccaceae bacterium]